MSICPVLAELTEYLLDNNAPNVDNSIKEGCENLWLVPLQPLGDKSPVEPEP